MNDHYATLYVLPSADHEVIKAAYRALAKRYHPDSYAGDKVFATQRMQDISAAFEVLGDPEKREAYDRERKKGSAGEEFTDNGEEDTKFNEDWDLACKYFPEAQKSFDYLQKLSRSLAFSFASYLLDTKNFNQCSSIARKFQRDFLAAYFGSDPNVQAFARRLILCGEMLAAKDVNKAVRVMGLSLDQFALRRRIYESHPQACKKLNFFLAIHHENPEQQIHFLKLVGVSAEGPLFFTRRLKLSFGGRDLTIRENQLRDWILEQFGHEEVFLNVWRGPLVDASGFRALSGIGSQNPDSGSQNPHGWHE